MRGWSGWMVVGVLIGGVAPAAANAQQRSAGVERAEALVRHLEAGRWSEAAAMMTPEVATQLDSARLSAVWAQIVSGAGELRTLSPRSEVEEDTLRVVELDAAFERAELVVRMVLTPAELVTGLWFLPPPPRESAVPYADRSRFEEEEIRVGEEPWVLPGTLSMPVGTEVVPAVVLVHGSGPNDRDETLGPNRPFRDLAWGLASEGVAVLRYDKRTRVHGARIGLDVTVEDEVIADALAAVALARAHPRIDPDHVILLGHSLGGYLAPLIAERDDQLGGVIMLAAPARRMAVLLREQLQYISSLPESKGEETAARLRALLDTVALLDSHELPPGQVVLGVPASYVHDLDARDPISAAAKLAAPLLILQGGRDYQVTLEDLELWRSALRTRDNVASRAYPSLNHLFMNGEGMATPNEYATLEGHVDEAVITDMAAWVRTGSLPPRGERP